MLTEKQLAKQLYDKEYKSKNKEKRTLQNKEYKRINKEIIAKKDKEYYEKNKERIAKYQHEWYVSNKENILFIEKKEEWRKSNKGRLKLYGHKYRALKRGSNGSLSKGLADKLFLLQKGKCPCCRKPLGKDYNLDHIVPISKGGSNTDDNIQLLRATCNKQKWAKDSFDFMQSRGFLF